MTNARALIGAIGIAVAAPAAAQQVVRSYPAYSAMPDPKTETVAITASGEPGARRFDLSTSAPQRDGASQRRTVREDGTTPFVASGSAEFDALFALAVDDAKRASVERIADDAYNGGKPVACHCFETGEKWHYVWTRDLSYALDLGLAGFDPARAVAALTFKTSALRPGVAVPPEIPAGSTQIVQDTGSGGSWPISTDRTAWALGAERTLANLNGGARAQFAGVAYAALRGTLEADRVAAFDPRDGLYGGEHSFLDWREQTYPAWIVDDLSAMAQMKALSTNVLQYRALRLAARLAGERGEAAIAARYGGWADALRVAIRGAFWDAKAGLFATYLSADATPARIAKYDLLGNDLAILSGVADARQSQAILSRYPFAPFGPPVVWPQAPGVFVYHNRAQWPFVTAYTLRAAAASAHVAAADRAVDALMRGAALHLSNYENLEWLTGRSKFDDGPEINSARQLWSVGGYLGAVTGVVFGWDPQADGVRVAPFLTAHVRGLLGEGTATLHGVRLAGKRVDIALALPPKAREGWWYPVRSVRLNGAPAPARLTASDLRDGDNLVEVTFDPARRSASRVTEAPRVPALSHDDPSAFSAPTPTVALAQSAGGPVLRVTGAARYAVLRDGVLVAKDVRAPTWSDPTRRGAAKTACYTVVATAALASQPSAAACDRGALAQTIPVDDAAVTSDAALMPPGDGVAATTRALGIGKRMAVTVRIARAGTYAIALSYDNHVFALNTGVTNAVKRLTVTDAAGAVQRAVVQMPHVRPVDAQHPLRVSTRAYVQLTPGTYTLALDDFLNMSALASNASYSNPGGESGPVNEARVAAVLVDAL